MPGHAPPGQAPGDLGGQRAKRQPLGLRRDAPRPCARLPCCNPARWRAGRPPPRRGSSLQRGRPSFPCRQRPSFACRLTAGKAGAPQSCAEPLGAERMRACSVVSCPPAWQALHRKLVLFAFICVHLRFQTWLFLAGAAPGLAASQAAKQVEPQMNANERKWRRSRSGRPVRVVIPSGRHRPLAPCPARQSHAEPATGRRADGGAGQEHPDGRGPDRTVRLAVAAGRGMRFSRKDPMQRGAGREDADGRSGPDRTARLAVVVGRGMRFSRKDPMQWGAGREDADGRSGPDRTARLVVVVGRGMRFSRNKPMQSSPHQSLPLGGRRPHPRRCAPRPLPPARAR